MTCIYDTRWCGPHGIGRFASELANRLEVTPLQARGRPMSPLDPFRLGGLAQDGGDWFLSPGYNAPLWSRSPYVLTLHDLNHLDRPDNSSVAKRLYYRVVLRRLCTRARAILTVSEFSRDRIADWSGVDRARIFNVGNGVSAAFSPRGERHVVGGGYALCVSNRRGHKNEAALFDAFARAGLPPTIELLLTGDPTDALRRLAVELGIAERVRFVGSVSEDQLGALYRGALFLVFPSLYEGFGLPIVEAFACGTPVITSNVTSMPEIAGDAALLVDPGSPDAIAAAMRELFASPPLRAELARRGQHRVADYSWDRVAQRVRDAVARVDLDPARPLNWN